MAKIAKKYRDKLDDIKDNVRAWHEYWIQNNIRYHKIRQFTYKTALSEDDLNSLQALQQPQIEANINKAFLARLLGEYASQQPTFHVMSADNQELDAQFTEVIGGHMRYILTEANKNSFEDDTRSQQMSGGFSVMKVVTEYSDLMGFDICISLKKTSDPTLCGFDVNASLKHKGDGEFCFELIPMTKESFETRYPEENIKDVKFTRTDSRGFGGFNWSYKNGKQEIILVCLYYEKYKKALEIVEIAPYIDSKTGRIVANKVMSLDEYEEFLEKWKEDARVDVPPVIKRQRKTYINRVRRYDVIENKVLEVNETDFSYLPLVFVDGDSQMLRDGEGSGTYQFTIPYVYNTLGIQELLNRGIQTLGNELENMIQHKFLVAVESLPKNADALDAYKNVQQASVLMYNHLFDQDPNITLPPPTTVQRQPIPPEVSQSIEMSVKMMQTILGTYDAALGISDKQLSGKAIANGAQNSNATSLPYTTNYMAALTQAAQIILDLIPKYYVTERTVPVIQKDGTRSYRKINGNNGLNLSYYSKSPLNVCVEAGANFAIQKQANLETLAVLGKSFPIFGEFMGQYGLQTIINNMDLDGMEDLREKAKQFTEMMDEQKKKMMNSPPPPDPHIIKAQAENQKTQMQGMKNQQDFVIRSKELELQEKELQNDHFIDLVGTMQSEKEMQVQSKKADAEVFAKNAELHMKGIDMHRTHSREDARLHHEMNKPKEGA